MLNYYSAYLKKDHNNTTIADVIAHAEHIKKIAGVDCMGLGGDFDGVEILPKDLEHPGKVRNLLEALYETGTWTEEDLEKLTSKNIRRVFAKVEEVRDSLKGEEPKQDALPVPQYWNSNTITQNFF
ncbi:putative dipeptidase MCYG_02918 [Folsomia candida]|uniref:putative dipeptidase MCYG_02918 n=1 Tax=Folsomia candida TaxID=158441 RepID=UPI001604F691|nr:putative dipeptidase MCYG_02918 [Folsomia candida]